MKASSRPLIKVMTAVNKIKAGSESESIPSVHPCNSNMPAEPATCSIRLLCYFSPEYCLYNGNGSPD